MLKCLKNKIAIIIEEQKTNINCLIIDNSVGKSTVLL